MLKTIAALLAAASLVVCISTPFAYFHDAIPKRLFEWVFALASIGWFTGATVFVSRK
jgi:hypothetical protein